MITNKKNIIQTVCFDIQVPDEGTATVFADQLGTVDCSSLFGKVLSRFGNVEESIRLDKVELDIGEIEPDDMELLRAEIETQFELMISRLIIDRDEQVPEKKVLRKGLKKPVPSATVDGIPMLLYYLNTGSLPWHVIDKPDMEQLFLELLEKDLPALKKALIPELRKARVIKRMVTVFSYSIIQRFVQQLLVAGDRTAVEKLEAIFEKNMSLSLWSEFRQQLLALWLTLISRTGELPENFSTTFIRIWVGVLSDIPIPVLQIIRRSIMEQVDTIPTKLPGLLFINITEAIDTVVARYQPKPHSKTEELTVEEPMSVETENAVEAICSEEKLREEKTLMEEEQEAEEESLPEGDHCFIDNAGLVLLNAALLQQYFVQLGWVEEKKIVTDQARHKMILWLDHLVWGKRKIHEYALMLNKVLVGMRPTDVADIKITLTADEIKAADELLETVIGHWAILKNTSIGSFRTTFLQRNGRLGNEDGGWQLYVQPKGYDVLVDSLPWSFSIIKLPWMQKPLFTQWQTKI